MTRMRFLIIPLLCVLAGCNLPYRPPADGMKTAKLRFYKPETGSYFDHLAIYALQGGSCMTATKLRGIGGDSVKGFRNLQLGGMSKSEIDIGMMKDPTRVYEDHMYVEIPVEADKRFEFSMHGEGGAKVCNLSLAFTPAAGREYEVSVFGNATHCFGTIFQIVMDKGQMLRLKEPTTEKTPSACKVFWN